MKYRYYIDRGRQCYNLVYLDKPIDLNLDPDTPFKILLRSGEYLTTPISEIYDIKPSYLRFCIEREESLNILLS